MPITRNQAEPTVEITESEWNDLQERLTALEGDEEEDLFQLCTDVQDELEAILAEETVNQKVRGRLETLIDDISEGLGTAEEEGEDEAA